MSEARNIKMMIFDTHAHYDDEAFDADRDVLLESMPERGIGAVANIASTIGSNEKCLELAHRYEHVFCALGVHPTECEPMTEETIEYLRGVLRDPKAVAVGEIGLDYYWENVEPSIQKKWFIRQLELAKELGKPVVIHSRSAAKETFDILRDSGIGETNGGVVHCYSYSAEMALEYVKMGFHIGVGGVITFKNARKLVETVEAVPLSRIVLETDCPYLAPVPYRGKRNNSGYLPLVAEKIAEITGRTSGEVIAVTTKNALDLYRLHGSAVADTKKGGGL